jgi:serine/threonine-protein kinase RsbW
MAESIIWKYTDSICSRTEDAVNLIRDLVKRLEKHHWSRRDVFGIHMAMEEAMMNAIKHGNSSDCSKKIHVEIVVSDVKFYSKITDDGSGFDPDQIPDPTAEENLERTSGRGIMLIKQFVDEVRYSDQGNSIELVKCKSKVP